jgi:hypothetical protein
VLCDQPIRASSSYNTPLEPVGPFWVLEYVSKSDKRKDYDDNFDKCEKQLKVPYYLVFYPDNQDLTLYHYQAGKYQAVSPDARGRCAIPQLDLEVGLLDGWVRYWHHGELLPLPAELQRDLDQTHRQMEEARRAAEEEKRRADELARRLEVAERELARLRGQLEPPPAGPERR